MQHHFLRQTEQFSRRFDDKFIEPAYKRDHNVKGPVMSDPQFDLAQSQMIAAGVATAAAGAWGWMFRAMQKLVERVSKVEITARSSLVEVEHRITDKIDKQTEMLWERLNADQRSASDQRAGMLQQMAALPTRDEMRNLISDAIGRKMNNAD